MTTRVTVIDYDMGNLFSVARALETCGAQVDLVTRPEEVLRAERLVLPGVGAFREGMGELNARELSGAIRQWVSRGRPLLGICLGMQMLFDASEEFGEFAGLGLLPGRVQKIPAHGADGTPLRVPHIGWNALKPSAGASRWSSPFMERTEPGESVYFVHSFTPHPDRAEHRIAEATYGGVTLAAVVGGDNVFGCQFHPEKSGPTGLRMLEAFLKL